MGFFEVRNVCESEFKGLVLSDSWCYCILRRLTVLSEFVNDIGSRRSARVGLRSCVMASTERSCESKVLLLRESVKISPRPQRHPLKSHEFLALKLKASLSCWRFTRFLDYLFSKNIRISLRVSIIDLCLPYAKLLLLHHFLKLILVRNELSILLGLKHFVLAILRVESLLILRIVS